VYSSIQALKRDIVEVGRRVYQRGYVASNDGNISARLDANRVLITPTGVSKGFMKLEDIIMVDMQGNVLAGHKKPSSEVFMHLRMYQERPDVNSVCHAHPVHATGFAVAGIPLVEYGTPGTAEFFEPVLQYLKDHDAFLLANHGALTIGKDVFNAYHKMETLEHFAHIAYVAMQVGTVQVLNPSQVQKLYDLRKRFGITAAGDCKSCAAGACSIAPTPTTSSSSSVAAGVPSDQESLIAQVTAAVLKQLK
jgi:L-fuculose-phosphate aldolase